jgi:hypothetical protein
MPRKFLDVSHVHPAIRETIANHGADIIREVQAAIAATKCGPGGVLVGGADDLARLIESGELTRMVKRMQAVKFASP